MSAFDSYVLGRPKIDEIEVKFIPDPNTLMANMLAGVELTIGRDRIVRVAEERVAVRLPATLADFFLQRIRIEKGHDGLG